VLFTDNTQVSTVPGRWRRVDEQFSDVNAVTRVPHGGSGVMEWQA
jgi:hypothetical protein